MAISATPAQSDAAPVARADTSRRQRALVGLARPALPCALIALVALLSRLRYAWFGEHAAFGSGDAHLMLTRALFISRGEWHPPAEAGNAASLFSTPPLVPLALAAFSRLTGLSLEIAPLILTPILTIVALVALYDIVRRTFGAAVALAGTALVALLPRFSFDSTEPDKIAYVVSFFILALWCVYASRDRRWLLPVGGLFMGLSVFSHTTGYLFLPVYVLALALFARPRLHPSVAAALVAPLLFIGAYVALDDWHTPALPQAAIAATPDPALQPIAASAEPALEPRRPARRSRRSALRARPGRTVLARLAPPRRRWLRQQRLEPLLRRHPAPDHHPRLHPRHRRLLTRP